MEKDIYELTDEIININHQITSYLIDFAQAEMEGQEVKVERNSILKLLFERLQAKYREIQQKLKDVQIVKFEDFINGNYTIVKDIEEDEDYANEETKDMKATTIDELLNYIESIYVNFHYISDNGDITKETIETQDSIYKGNGFEDLRYMEYIMQRCALEDMRKRMVINEETRDLSFDEKRYVLTDLAEKKFYKEFAIRQVSQEIKELESKKEETELEKYERIRRKLYESKYIAYYEYLNNMYNGIIQENEIGKLARIKKFIDAGAEQIILGMTKYEIEQNIRIDITKMQNDFIEAMDITLEVEDLDREI